MKGTALTKLGGKYLKKKARQAIYLQHGSIWCFSKRGSGSEVNENKSHFIKNILTIMTCFSYKYSPVIADIK